MMEKTDMSDEIQKRVSNLIAEKIADAIEKRSFLRTLLDEQIEKSDGDKKEKLISELGTFGQKDDNEEAIESLLEDTVPDFVERLYERLCADDTRLHNTFWLLGNEAAAEIHEKIAENDGVALNRIISKFVFTFNDLPRLDSFAIQKVLREVDSMELATALKFAKAETAEVVFKNMSIRAAQALKEDMDDFKHLTTKKNSLEAQRKIMNIIQRLADAGEIELPYYANEYDEDGYYL